MYEQAIFLCSGLPSKDVTSTSLRDAQAHPTCIFDIFDEFEQFLKSMTIILGKRRILFAFHGSI